MPDDHSVPLIGEILDNWMAARAATTEYFNPANPKTISEAWAQELVNLLEEEDQWRTAYLGLVGEGFTGGLPGPNI